MELEIRNLLLLTIKEKAAELHLTVGLPPVLRINGHLVKLDTQPLSAAHIEQYVHFLLKDEQWDRFAREGEVDVAYSLAGVGRFRVNAYRQRGSCALALRVIPTKIPSFEELHLPDAVRKLALCSQGLVLVTGPTRSGKTTTLAAMIDLINRERNCLVITLEAPIEYLHQHQLSIVNQREIGEDTKSFNSGLCYALCQNPDVIMVGDLPDLKTIEAAISAAEKGHLVIAGFSTLSVTQTLERLVGIFSPERRQQLRIQLAAILQGIISQQLLPRADDDGWVPAVEIMIATPAIRSLIRTGNIDQLLSTIETGERYGMQTLATSRRRLFEAGLIDQDHFSVTQQ
jgi:twitching motility protein PilT